ncbi:septum site-determining protein MinC [Vibrio sp. SS-MA-C1-2]|uniref:septum site-determining protein MinC n=1 Tax=Vibrio sp. SS-MA-C1-2 TaxID=2908646 RepID=UPI001F177E77|nr:septum site-determining protein MinC [Vibrio sp. SS-MA-C1-2]UJF19936.1 septum site-determining protein MinC [Vibrio sp. SS-MA-C1-2]
MTTPAELKGSSFTLSVLHLHNTDMQQTKEMLTKKVAQAPLFFQGAPVVINIEKVDTEINSKIDFVSLKEVVTEAGFIPVGISGCSDQERQAEAKSAGFAIMNTAKAIKEQQNTMTPTKVISTPVRSGQQIYAKDSDLVILTHVNPGAEIIADGSIHIYGSLRGRAIAGASGQEQASIICKDIQAELVSIAGQYWLSDKIPKEFWKKSGRFQLVDDQIKLTPLVL